MSVVEKNLMISLANRSLFDVYDFPEKINSDSWKEALRESVFQTIVPLVYDGTEGMSDIPKDILHKFKQTSVSVFNQNDRVINAQYEIVKNFEKASIGYVIIKGTSVGGLYKKPHLRQYGDIDILVDNEDMVMAADLIESLGYRFQASENSIHIVYVKSDIIVELHHEVHFHSQDEHGFYQKKYFSKAIENRVQAVFDGHKYYVLDEKRQYISLLLHIEQHFNSTGLGLRQLYDVACFLYNKRELIEDSELAEILKECGLYKLSKTIINLCYTYFYNESTIYRELEKESKQFLLEALKYGNFGYKANNLDLLQSDILAGNDFFIFKWYKYFKRRASITWPLARKHRWLTPLGIVYIPARYALRIVFGKRKFVRVKDVVKTSVEKEKMYDRLGLFDKEENS